MIVRRIGAWAKTHWVLTYVITCIALLLLGAATGPDTDTSSIFVLLLTFALFGLPVVIVIALYQSMKQRRASRQDKERLAAPAPIEAEPLPAEPQATPESIRAALQRHKLFTTSKFLCPCGYEGIAGIVGENKSSAWPSWITAGLCLLLAPLLPILAFIAGAALVQEPSRKRVVMCPSCEKKYSLDAS
jgi:hypothetical protein